MAQYVAYLRGVGLAPSSIARSMVSVRSLHKFLVQEGTTETDPTLDLKPPPVPQGLPKALSEDEVGCLLAAVTGGRTAAAARPRRPRASLRHGNADLRADRPIAIGPGGRGPARACSRQGAAKSAWSLWAVMPAKRLAAWMGPGGRPVLVPGEVGAESQTRTPFSSTYAGDASLARALGGSSGSTGSGWAWTGGSARTSCATAVLPTCSTTAPTSGSSKNSSVTLR